MKYDVFLNPEFKADCERDQIEYGLNRKEIQVEIKEPLDRHMCREFKERIKNRERNKWN